MWDRRFQSRWNWLVLPLRGRWELPQPALPSVERHTDRKIDYRHR